MRGGKQPKTLYKFHLYRIFAHYKRDFPSIDVDGMLYGASTVILRYYLGQNWGEKFIQPIDSESMGDPGQHFLKLSSDGTIEDGYRHQERLLRLAEFLYNFQFLPNIHERRKHLIGGEDLRGGQIESTFAEFQSMKFFSKKVF